MLVLYAFGSLVMSRLKNHVSEIYGLIPTFQLTESNIFQLVLSVFLLILFLLSPLIIAIVLSSFASSFIQSEWRFEFSTERLAFDFGRLNPLSGFKRMFNKDAFAEMVKSLLKIIIVGYIAYNVMRDEIQNIMLLAESDVAGIVAYTSHMAFRIVVHTCGIMLILGIFDLMYIKWRYIENLMMTKQEVKDESKDLEGNPEIKGKIKSLQFQMARRRMIKIIPTADVVVTNPTHFAVALKYEREKMAAPKVIAKGMDEMALAIKKIAEEHKVILVENRFLARELYDQVKENEEIPESLFAAVAEVLAYVYRLKGRL